MIRHSIISFGLFCTISSVAYAQPKYQANETYPAAALAAGAQGTAAFEIVVGKNGQPKSCRITQSAGHPDLDNATCEIMMRRGKFHPKLDDAGEPIEFTYNNRMRWEIPDTTQAAKSK
ncbi:MAG: TonB family protein [Sphingopyxis sp.]|uniref:energy transducer TonB n=1 Tax=Sphingopyxis sp. TaxID=1908224 RepID=UPI002ABB955B|nr:TonB family protein [Sphingopyxis sp.]MDZ3831463.1 TonB family protein [Sphingopyxis sp.]